GSHLKLRYQHPQTGEIRNVTVPMGGEIRTGTLRNIADQCGAKDFEAFCEWIDENR
ncbi:type II toxin-antitoxin system HicA family toxin, partial [Salinisphaera sp. USBA-960]|nr:type II toxin-antitoxin system HicA family toxin [Salifodinibacter halophilus]